MDPIVPGLLWLELSHCTSFIVFENVIATTAVLTLMPKFMFHSYSSVADNFTVLFSHVSLLGITKDYWVAIKLRVKSPKPSLRHF